MPLLLLPGHMLLLPPGQSCCSRAVLLLLPTAHVATATRPYCCYCRAKLMLAGQPAATAWPCYCYSRAKQLLPGQAAATAWPVAMLLAKLLLLGQAASRPTGCPRAKLLQPRGQWPSCCSCAKLLRNCSCRAKLLQAPSHASASGALKLEVPVGKSDWPQFAFHGTRTR